MKIRECGFCLFSVLIFLSVFLFITGCEEQVTRPKSMKFSMKVIVKDSSDYTLNLTGKNLVPDATVHINSINYRLEGSGMTGRDGLFVFQQLLPDRYNISVSKFLSPDSVLKAEGVFEARVQAGQVQEKQFTGEDSVVVWVSNATLGSLVISEIYYNGAPPPPPYYFHDQFTEIYNNSDTTFYLDGLLMASVEYGYADTDYMHAVHVFQFPGAGTEHPLAPGEMAIIAQDAINHLEANPKSLDLTGADFEYYKADKGDVDNPDVPNMIQIHSKYGIDFLYSVMNDGIILFKVDDPYSLQIDTWDEMMIPVDAIIDGVEYREDLSEYQYKRFPPKIDSGMSGGMPPYKGKSIERKIDRRKNGRIILMDNNNSSIDFDVIKKPTPGTIHE